MRSEPNGSASGHLLYVWSPQGYALHEREGDPPAPHELVELGEAGRFVVQKLGASPYPDDARPCAFLIREP